MAARSRAGFLRVVFLATILVGLIGYLMVQGQSPASETFDLVRGLVTGADYEAKPLADAPDLSDPSKLRRPRQYLVPDKRFTGALERIHAFYVPDEPVTATVEYREDGWDVALGDISFRWPEPVDFGDYLSAAEQVMDALDASHPIELMEGSVEDATLAEFDKRLGAGHLVLMIDIVIEADALWSEGKRDPRLLVYAAEVAGRMTMEDDDVLEMSDPMDTYALSLASLERQFRPFKGTDRREIRLAYLFGYRTYARSRANTLDETDPIRALALEDYGGAKRTLPYAGASPYERFLFERWRIHTIGGEPEVLYRRTLAKRPFDQAIVGDLTGLNWWGTVQEVPPIQASLTGLALTALMETGKVSAEYRAMLATESADADVYEANQRQFGGILKRYSDPFDVRLWMNLQRFEEQPSGPLMDYAAASRIFRSYLLSSIHRVGEHIMDKYSSVEGAIEYLDAIPDKIDRELSDYRRWYAAKLDEKRAAKTAWAQFETILGSPGSLGHLPLIQAYNACGSYGFEAPLAKRQRESYSRIHNLADGRPRFRSAFAYSADSHLFDRFRQLEELESLKRLAEDSWTEKMIWYAVANRDVDRVRQFLADEDNNVARQIELARHLAMLEGWSDQRLAEHLTDLAFSSDSSTCFYEVIDIYRKVGEHRKIVELGRKWLPGGTRVSSIAEANMRAQIAAAHYMLGEYDVAWELIEPAIPVYNESSLVWGSRILDKRGEGERARELAEASVERYSDNLYSRMVLVEWHWNRDDYEAAAKVITAPGVRIVTANWTERFNASIERVFKGRSRDDLRAAMRALLAAGFPPTPLAQAADKHGKEGELELALAILLEVQPVSSREMWVVPDIYRYMEAVDGVMPARQWWAEVPSREQYGNASAYFHTNGLHEYLWTLYPADHGETDVLHVVLQAAACALEPEINEKYGDSLREYLSGVGNRWGYTIARYLLGEDDDPAFRGRLRDPKCLSEVAYFKGLFAENEGRISDALQWYLVCTDAGYAESGPFIWATSRLRQFNKQIVTPEIAEAEWQREHGAGVI